MNLYIPDAGALRHEMIMGKSGSGKTEYLKFRLQQQLLRGGGAFIVDAKLDYDFLDDIYSLCKTYYREADLRVINIDDAAKSHTYNPLLHGDANAVASRISDTVDAGENASAEHFKQMAYQALLATLGAVQDLGLAYNAMDLFILLSNPEAMQWLLRQTPDGEGKTQYTLFLDSFRIWDKASKAYVISVERLRAQIGGVAARLYPYGIRDMGEVLGSYSPEVNLLDAIDNQQIVYFMLPSLEKNEAAMAFARLFLSDLQSVAAQLYKRPKSGLPFVPHEIYMDEFGSWAIQAVTKSFEMFRGARIALLPAFQTAANLCRLGEGFADQIMGNTEINIFLTLGDANSQLLAATLSGQTLKSFESRSQGSASGSGNRHLDIQLFHTINKSESSSISVSERYDYRVRPEEFGCLKVGEAIVIAKSAGACYKVRLPLAKPAKKETFVITRYRTPARVGLNLSQKFEAEFSLSGT